MYEYRATIIAAIDADTLDVDIDLGLHTHVRARLRVIGLNAPERYTPHGRVASAWASSTLPIGSRVIVRTQRDRTEKYGRWLAAIELPDGRDYGAAAVAAGHAVAWDGAGQKP